MNFRKPYTSNAFFKGAMNLILLDSLVVFFREIFVISLVLMLVFQFIFMKQVLYNTY